MTKILRRVRKDENGVTALEYGLIAALVALAIVGTVTTMGTNLTNVFTAINTQLTNALPKT